MHRVLPIFIHGSTVKQNCRYSPILMKAKNVKVNLDRVKKKSDTTQTLLIIITFIRRRVHAASSRYAFGQPAMGNNLVSF